VENFPFVIRKIVTLVSALMALHRLMLILGSRGTGQLDVSDLRSCPAATITAVKMDFQGSVQWNYLQMMQAYCWIL
jgi:hypothetical protein